MFKQLIIMNVGLVVCTILALIYFIGRDKLKRAGKWELEKKRKMHNRFTWYYNNVLIRSRFRRIAQKYSTLCCYSKDKVKEESVKLFEHSVVVAVLMPIIAIATIHDVMITVLVALVGYVYYDVNIDKAIDGMYTEVLKELSNCIQSIREEYMQTDNVATAVLYSDKGKYLEESITQIYEILTDVDGEGLLEEFCRVSPIRLIKTLANTCFIVNETGDERDAEGNSAFSAELTTLRQEVDTEIRRLEKTRIAFKSLGMLTLIGLAVLPAAEGFLLTQIPGTAILLKGVYGLVAKAVVIGITITAYYIISVINRPSIVNQSDRIEWLDSLSKNKKVNRKLQTIMPKKFKTRRKLELMLKDSLSSKTLDYIYLSKVIFAGTAFVLIILLLFVFTVSSKSYLYNNYRGLGFIPGQPMKEDTYVQIEKMDKEYLALKAPLSKEDTIRFAKGRVRGLKEYDYQIQADRLLLKYRKYDNIEFKWYYIIIAYGGAVLGWYGPEIALKFRRKLVQYESIEDVMQLQTMMIVLSHTKMDVFKSLFWLERQATIHKAPLRYAYHEFPSDPEGTLVRLGESTNSNEFKRLVSKLKTAIYNLSLKDAFSDMILDKEQSLRLREMLQDETLESKKQWAKLIAIAPAALTVLLLFMAPILILGVTELMNTFKQLQGYM